MTASAITFAGAAEALISGGNVHFAMQIGVGFFSRWLWKRLILQIMVMKDAIYLSGSDLLNSSG